MYFLQLLAVAFCWTALPDVLETTTRIGTEITQRGMAFSNLQELTSLGHRLCCSKGAEKAVEWAKRKMESYHFDRVYLQPVKIPCWDRGKKENAAIVKGGNTTPLSIAALGRSIGTPEGGILAQVVEVNGLEEVERLGVKVRGKIVFYNRPMDPQLKPGEAYRKASDQRRLGPDAAAKQGAVAVLVRSLTTLQKDDHPHTGALSYQPEIHSIPAAALGIQSAEKLSAALRRHPDLQVRLTLSAQTKSETTSYNVVGELKGRELPNEYFVVGAHLDSWDLATGAQDNGAGVVESIEVLRALRKLKIAPRRTLRAVLYMAEEIGGLGGQEYAKQAQSKKEKHTGALESDRGAAGPEGFTVDAGGKVLALAQSWRAYLDPWNASDIKAGPSGTDVEPLKAFGVPAFGFVPDMGHYFDIHHSALDKISAVNPRELHASAAAMAVFSYLASEIGFE